jgi:hypothetical protein
MRAGFAWKWALLLGLAGVVVVAGAAESGPTVLRSQLICDIDGLAPFTDVVGSVRVNDQGDVKIKVKGLRPDTTYTCRMICSVGGLFEDAACTTDKKGAINATLRGLGRSGALADGCGQPIFTMFTDDPDDEGDFCMTGYGMNQ